MRAVDKLFQPLLGDKQHRIKQEEGSLLLHSVHLEGTFQNQLSEAAEVRPAPVHQQGLDFLRGGEMSENRLKRTKEWIGAVSQQIFNKQTLKNKNSPNRQRTLKELHIN